MDTLDRGMIHISSGTVRDFIMPFRTAHDLKHELFILEFFNIFGLQLTTGN